MTVESERVSLAGYAAEIHEEAHAIEAEEHGEPGADIEQSAATRGCRSWRARLTYTGPVPIRLRREAHRAGVEPQAVGDDDRRPQINADTNRLSFSHAAYLR